MLQSSALTIFFGKNLFETETDQQSQPPQGHAQLGFENELYAIKMSRGLVHPCFPPFLTEDVYICA